MNSSLINTFEPLTHVPDGIALDNAFERSTHLAIGAHQDDLEIFAYHGIAACYDSETQWFGGVTVTDGGGSARTGPYANYSDEEMKQIRHQEQNRAADIGKYGFQCQLNLPSVMVKDEASCSQWVRSLSNLLRKCRPHTLYLHNPADKHPTHLAVLKLSIAALRLLDETEWPQNIYGCEVWRDLDWMRDEDKVALPVDRHPELARVLIEVFESQIAGGKNYTEASLGRRSANATYFSSHSVDTCLGLTYAMDLRPLLETPDFTPELLVDLHIGNFRNEVASAYRSLID